MAETNMANLVIVESPAKATTIKGYLGSNYKVIACKGHVRDLPKSSLGVDIEAGFQPHYINIRGKSEVINQLKKEAKSATKIFLATDPDREGEAISWHLATALDIPLDKECRVAFNEITKEAVKYAVKHPRRIDTDLVNSQQARRILDRIVGYQLSPFLWKNVKNGLSAGRVQSVLTRLICEREEEIRAFVPTAYFTIEAVAKVAGGGTISVHFVGGEQSKSKISDEALAYQIEAAVRGGSFRVQNVKAAQKTRMPQAPFTTSTMQQEASKRLGFQAEHIMRIAQELYEGINLGADLGGVQGLITYMRTDSQRISESAKESAALFIGENFGPEYVPATPNQFKSKTNSQDAHEAIRPTQVTLTPAVVRGRLSQDQYKLYRLIWERFVASQMASAIYDTVTVDMECAGHQFRASGYTVKFRGYTAVSGQNQEEMEEGDSVAGTLPTVAVGDTLEVEDVLCALHHTEPPARYNEASLVKVLEESGIYRPSTYATMITTILAREYVKRQGRSLVPTPLGEITNRLMKESFPGIVDTEFTAILEEKLDSIEHGGIPMEQILSDFYQDFSHHLERAMESVKKEALPVETSDIECKNCGEKMVYRSGRFGKFLACPNYPTCRTTYALDRDGNPIIKATQQKTETVSDMKCQICGSEMVLRRGKFGEFYACSAYPTCKYTQAIIQDTGVPCPKCNSRIIVRHSRDRKVFYSCERYPECDWSSWDMPLGENCPECGSMLLYKKLKKTVVCSAEGCEYTASGERKVIE